MPNFKLPYLVSYFNAHFTLLSFRATITEADEMYDEEATVINATLDLLAPMRKEM